MKHLGDIAAVDWSKVEPVDVVTGGSPCQDLSVAGKRAGLAGERSSLYMEQIRCVKELREADVLRGRTGQFIRPRYMVWENVIGAFSSGKPKGADFAAVIEEIIKVAEPGTAVSVCVPNGGWTKSGCYYAQDGSWSIAWRVHDAQFWGVPQRRKRISLVADFGGLSAPEVLFERKGLSGHSEESGAQRESTASYAERGVGADDRAGNCVIGVDGYNQCSTGNVAKSMTAISSDYHHVPCVVYPTAVNDQHLFQPMSLREENWAESEVKNAIRAGESKSSHVVVQPIAISSKQQSLVTSEDVANTLGANDYKEPQAVCLPMAHGFPLGFRPENTRCYDIGEARLRTPSEYLEVSPTITARCGTGGNNVPAVVYEARGNGDGDTVSTLTGDHENRITDYIVRRLTPLECERLQGYPDGWTDIGEWTDSKGKKHKEADSPRYKALGNSIALPFWKWLLKRISAQYERDATLGSLFDGIGGFPLCWEQINGKGSARWASEIEDFPIAVTKIRFPEEN